MIAPLHKLPSNLQDRVNAFGWQVFTVPAERGALLALETSAPADEAAGDAIVERVRWLLPESEYGLQIVRAYAAPGLGALELRDYFWDAIASNLPRRAERLLLIVDGFDFLERSDRIAHLGTLRLALRKPNVVVAVATKGVELRECRFFDRVM
jgi:hypothetical protein